jgi:hypothetical protein
MKITIVGRDNIGGGLARMRTPAGHDVTTLAATPIVPAQGAPFDDSCPPIWTEQRYSAGASPGSPHESSVTTPPAWRSRRETSWARTPKTPRSLACGKAGGCTCSCPAGAPSSGAGARA